VCAGNVVILLLFIFFVFGILGVQVCAFELMPHCRGLSVEG
jgi:hypothetical protein